MSSDVAVQICYPALVMNWEKERNEYEVKSYREGGGVWFHRQTHSQVLVLVDFYPRVILRIDGKEISKNDLRANYYRLRL